MFQLLPREQALIIFLLVAALLGFAVKHERDCRRERLPAKRPASAPVHAAEPPLAGKAAGR